MKHSIVTHTQHWGDVKCIYVMESLGRAMIRITKDPNNPYDLSDLYVEEDWRRHGLGDEILDTAIRLCKHDAKQNGDSEVIIELATNKRSSDFCESWYKRKGFEFVGMQIPMSEEPDETENLFQAMLKI